MVPSGEKTSAFTLPLRPESWRTGWRVAGSSNCTEPKEPAASSFALGENARA
jgi:hypothetical protein